MLRCIIITASHEYASKAIIFFIKNICADENPSIHWITKIIDLFKYAFMALVFNVLQPFFFFFLQGSAKG